MVHENCGVVGIFSLGGENIIPYLIDCLRVTAASRTRIMGYCRTKEITF